MRNDYSWDLDLDYIAHSDKKNAKRQKEDPEEYKNYNVTYYY